MLLNFGLSSFEVQELINPAISYYTALQLLDSGEGQATFLLCRKTYAAEQLTRFTGREGWHGRSEPDRAALPGWQWHRLHSPAPL